MSEHKPWDVLRAKKTKPPIQSGSWETTDGAIIEFEVDGDDVDLKIQGWLFGPRTLRELSEFCLEMAEQLEAQCNGS